MMIRRVLGRSAFAIALIGALTVPPASALWASTTGAYAYTTNSDRTVNITDLASDGQFVSANYYISGVSSYKSLVNKAGAYTTLSKSAGGKVTTLRACVSQTAKPMKCSAWR